MVDTVFRLLGYGGENLGWCGVGGDGQPKTPAPMIRMEDGVEGCGLGGWEVDVGNGVMSLLWVGDKREGR